MLALTLSLYDGSKTNHLTKEMGRNRSWQNLYCQLSMFQEATLQWTAVVFLCPLPGVLCCCSTSECQEITSIELLLSEKGKEQWVRQSFIACWLYAGASKFVVVTSWLSSEHKYLSQDVGPLWGKPSAQPARCIMNKI